MAREKEENIANESSTMRKELGSVKMDKELMKEQYRHWCSQAALQVVDFTPEAPLRVVKSMSDAEREEMIKDRLPARVPLSVSAYRKAKDEGRNDAAVLQSITEDTITTSLELVEEGSLPDIHTNRMAKTRLKERCVNVIRAMAGDAPPDACQSRVFNKALKKHGKAHGKGGCAWCGSQKETCFWDMDAGETTSKPDESTTAHVIGFCKDSCPVDFRCMPICPKCGSDRKRDHVKKPGEGLASPSAIVEMSKHAKAMIHIRRQLNAQDITDSFREELQGRLTSEKSACADAEQNSLLPNLWCRACDEQCCPRDASVMTMSAWPPPGCDLHQPPYVCFC